MPKAAKRNSDHAQRHNTPTLNNEAISLTAWLAPADRDRLEPESLPALESLSPRQRCISVQERQCQWHHHR